MDESLSVESAERVTKAEVYLNNLASDLRERSLRGREFRSMSSTVENAIKQHAKRYPANILQITDLAMKNLPSHDNSRIITVLNYLILEGEVKRKVNELKSFNAALKLREVYLKLMRRVEVFAWGELSSQRYADAESANVGTLKYVNIAFFVAYANIKCLPSCDARMAEAIEKIREPFQTVETDLLDAIEKSESLYEAQLVQRRRQAVELLLLTDEFRRQKVESTRPSTYYYFTTEGYLLRRSKIGQAFAQDITKVQNMIVSWVERKGKQLVALHDIYQSRERGRNHFVVLDLVRDFARVDLPRRTHISNKTHIAYYSGHLYALNDVAKDTKPLIQGERYSFQENKWEDIRAPPSYINISMVNLVQGTQCLYAIGSEKSIEKTYIAELCLVTCTWRCLDIRFSSVAGVLSFTAEEFPDALFIIQGYWMYKFDAKEETYKRLLKCELQYEGVGEQAPVYRDGVLYYCSGGRLREHPVVGLGVL
mmetsp:Transcript_23918/g.42374  ORF Transcript_23918/g.42374 Transcript_23918/m.42374 type:complete len:482 (+) Transcript_23918:1101-2546(+)